MKIVYFTHSLASCWNHGNAHFLRGVLRELVFYGQEVVAWEPADSWSLQNLLADHGPESLDPFRRAYPELRPRFYGQGRDLAELVDGADLVVVHEWNEPDLVAELGAMRKAGARFLLLFHDTHHRAVSNPEEMREFDLDGFDGILAFGEALAEVYRRWGWGRRVFVWHEAADTRHFHPPDEEGDREGLVWIGNWGDGERSTEIRDFLLRPARKARLPLDVHGVRYSPRALRQLRRHRAAYRGWAPNARVPELFARAMATVHVPRRYYAETLPGIPTIRVFEALACGIPLASAPWADCEGLFREGRDFVIAHDRREMTALLRSLAADEDMRAELAANGLETIAGQHSCRHRAEELLDIVEYLASGAEPMRRVAA